MSELGVMDASTLILTSQVQGCIGMLSADHTVVCELVDFSVFKAICACVVEFYCD